VSPVRYELGFYTEKTAFFIVTAVKTSNLTCITFSLDIHRLYAGYSAPTVALRVIAGDDNGAQSLGI
jgi:hypothetical protein